MAIVVSDLEFGYPGRDSLFWEVSFKVGTGEHVGLVGDNAAGKSTLLQVVAGRLAPLEGNVAVDGRVAYMPQAIGLHDDPVIVREFLARLAPARVQRAAEALWAAEAANAADPTTDTGMRLAAAHGAWAEVHGYELEAQWDAGTTSVLRQPFTVAAHRPVNELSGGERKRLALEFLLRSDADVLLLDEPDNFLDIPAKRWLEAELTASRKTILMISHDRELLSRAVDKLVTVEANGAWVHGGSFATYHEARDSRNERLGNAVARWKAEERRLYRYMKLLKQRASFAESAAAKADAAETRWKRWVAAGPPPEPPPEQRVNMNLRGADSGKRVLRCQGLELSGLTEPFDVDVFQGERVAVLGPNGSGKSHFMRLLAGEPVDHGGGFQLGARVQAALFSQTNERRDLVGRTPYDVLLRPLGSEEKAMRALGRYGLSQVARSDFSELSGGQQARLQILTLEAEGNNLLLLDEPTDNLDLVSSEALEEALAGFVGTVIAVTHDRWFMRGFDRFLIFGLDGSVTEALDLDSALAVITGDDTAAAHLVPLSG